MSQAFMYDEAVAGSQVGEMNWVADDVRVMLVSDGYEPDQASHRSVEDVARFEVDAAGSYERGGAAVSGREVMRSEFGGEIRLRASSLSWPDVTAEFRYAVLYARDSGRLWAYSDMGVQRVTSAAVNLSYGKDGVAAFMIATPTGV